MTKVSTQKTWVLLLGVATATALGAIEFLNIQRFADEESWFWSEGGSVLYSLVLAMITIAAWVKKPKWRLAIGSLPLIVLTCVEVTDLLTEAMQETLINDSWVAVLLLNFLMQIFALLGTHLALSRLNEQNDQGDLILWVGPMLCQLATIGTLGTLYVDFSALIPIGIVLLIICTIVWIKRPTWRWTIVCLPLLSFISELIADVLLEHEAIQPIILALFVAMAGLVTAYINQRNDGELLLKNALIQCIFFAIFLSILFFGGIIVSQGYPFAWSFDLQNSNGKNYWMPLQLLMSINAISLLLVPLFWTFRSILFGNGRPWLAGIALIMWTLSFSTAYWVISSEREPWWLFVISMDNDELTESAEAAYKKTFVLSDLSLLKHNDIDAVCRDAPLNKFNQFYAIRNQLPALIEVPADVIKLGLMESDLCPKERLEQFTRYKNAKTMADAAYPPAELLPSVFGYGTHTSIEKAFHRLAAQPDVDVQLQILKQEPNLDELTRAVAFAELHARVMLHGQLKEPVWSKVEGYDNSSGEIVVDARHWHEPHTRLDQRMFWYQKTDTGGAISRYLASVNCNEIFRSKNHYSIHNLDKTPKVNATVVETVVLKGTAEWKMNHFICSGDISALTLVESAGERIKDIAASSSAGIQSKHLENERTSIASKENQNNSSGSADSISSTMIPMPFAENTKSRASTNIPKSPQNLVNQPSQLDHIDNSTISKAKKPNVAIIE